MQCKSGGTDVDIFILDTGRKGRREGRGGREGGRKKGKGRRGQKEEEEG